MAEFDNTNRGSIWKNVRKEKETHPDFTGSINVDGKEFWLNGWLRKPGAKEKAPAMTFSVNPKTGGGGGGNAPASSPVGEDDIPF